MRSNLFVLIISILFISNAVQCQNIKWSQKKGLPKEYRNGSATSCKGKVYFMGGYCQSTPERFEKSNYEYNPDTDTWTLKADMPSGHSNFALITIEDKIYAIGGDPFSPQNEEYTPATDSWKTLKPMLTPRQHISGTVVDGKIYIIGGLMDFKDSSAPSDWSYKNISNKNEVYNPLTDSWEELAPMPTRRHGAFITAVNGKIFVIGGMGDKKDIWKSLSVVEMYDPGTNTWETKKSLPESRDGFGISVINDKIYVIGGFSISGVVNTVRVYNPQLDSWSESTEFPNLNNGSAGCASIGNKIFVIGGCDSKYVANGNTFVGVLNSIN